MKRSAILLLLVCTAALPAAARAQDDTQAEVAAPDESVGVLTTNWSLKQPRKKAVAQTASVAGPAVPPTPVVKYPKPKQRTTRQRLPNNRTNAAKTITQVIRK